MTMSLVREEPPNVQNAPTVLNNESKPEVANNAVETPVENAVADDCHARFLVQLNVTPEELANGHQVSLAELVRNLPDGNVIVKQISANALGSNVPVDIMCSANLFNTRDDTHYSQMGVSNANGWLSSASESSTVPNGYVPLVNIMPNEYSRDEVKMYNPQSIMEDKLVQRYGHLTNMKDLWQNIVPFPGEDYYYVGRDHVVLSIIEKNWEQLGINVPSERLRDQNWVKVAASVVNKVINELNDAVLSQIPFSNLNDMNLCFSANPDLAQHLDQSSAFPISAEFTIKYSTPS